MVTCSGCGRPIEKLPDWLAGVTVEYVCNNCPNRQTKNIAFVNLEAGLKTAPEAEEVDVEEVAEEDDD
jgi:hypothetical protein